MQVGQATVIISAPASSASRTRFDGMFVSIGVGGSPPAVLIGLVCSILAQKQLQAAHKQITLMTD